MYHLWDILLPSFLTSFCKGESLYICVRVGTVPQDAKLFQRQTPNCWRFVRNPAETHQLRLVVCPIIYKVLYIPRWLFGISEPSTIWLSTKESCVRKLYEVFHPTGPGGLVVTIWKAPNSIHSGRQTWQWKMNPKWRCISYWKWWYSFAVLVYQRVEIASSVNQKGDDSVPPLPNKNQSIQLRW